MVPAVLLVVGIGLVGYFAGSSLTVKPGGGTQAERKPRELEAQAQERLEKYAQQVRIGAPVPEFTLWTADMATALRFQDALPAGGVAVLLSPGCDSCLGEVIEIQRVVDSLGHDSHEIVLIADRGGGVDSLVAHLRHAGVTLPVFCDAQETMRRELRLIPRTVYIRVDSDGVVRDMQAWREHPADLSYMFRKDDSFRDSTQLVNEMR